VSQTGGARPEGYTYSPDGRWWWDGRNWQPVDPSLLHAGPPRRQGNAGRWLVAAAIVLVVASSLPAALYLAAFALRAAHPPPPGPFPTTHYLADTSVTGIEVVATSHGLQCSKAHPVSFGGRAPAIHDCHGSTSSSLGMFVETIGPDDSHVSVVSADVGGPAAGDRSAALDLLQAVVRAAVSGPDGPADAAWVSDHFDQSGTSQTVVDGVELRLMAHGPVRSLIVQPA